MFTKRNLKIEKKGNRLLFNKPSSSVNQERFKKLGGKFLTTTQVLSRNDAMTVCNRESDFLLHLIIHLRTEQVYEDIISYRGLCLKSPRDSAFLRGS